MPYKASEQIKTNWRILLQFLERLVALVKEKDICIHL